MEMSAKPTKRNNSGKRVLMIIENAGYPQDIRVQSEALTLISAGYTVSVICPAEKRQPSREVIEGVNIYRYPEPPTGNGLLAYLVEYGFSLLSIFYLSLVVLFTRGFDTLHTANPPDIIVLIGALYKLFGKRFVFDQHDLSPEIYSVHCQGKGNSIVHKLLLFFEKFSCQLADHVFVANQSSKQIVKERDKIPEERITVVRNGPSIKMMQSVKPDMDLRQRGRFTIVYVGKISIQDGLDYLIRALRHLAVDLRRKNFHCYVIGDGPALKSVQAMATNIGLDENIIFTGWVTRDTVKRYIASSDICVDPEPSNEYNDRCTTIKMMEYMSLGKPIVAFDLPEHRFTAGEASVYACPNNELEFAKYIACLVDDPDLCEKMGRIGRERLEKELAWPYQAEHLLDAYKSMNA
jgi:glycosyltransferase involved in cell wall biosynthesis